VTAECLPGASIRDMVERAEHLNDDERTRAAAWQARYWLELAQDEQHIPLADRWRPSDAELQRLVDHARWLQSRHPSRVLARWRPT